MHEKRTPGSVLAVAVPMGKEIQHKVGLLKTTGVGEGERRLEEVLPILRKADSAGSLHLPVDNNSGAEKCL